MGSYTGPERESKSARATRTRERQGHERTSKRARLTERPPSSNGRFLCSRERWRNDTWLGRSRSGTGTHASGRHGGLHRESERAEEEHEQRGNDASDRSIDRSLASLLRSPRISLSCELVSLLSVCHTHAPIIEDATRLTIIQSQDTRSNGEYSQARCYQGKNP